MIQLRHLLLLSAFVLLNSCAFHRGYLSSNAVLVNQNFQVLGVAKGTSEATKVFGFGGLQKDALVYDAKNDLYNRTNLKAGQGLTNITVDFKNSFYFIFSKQKVTVTAEVIDFNQADKEIINNYGQYGFITGDTIYAKLESDFKKVTVEVALPSGISIFDPETKESKVVEYDHCFNQTGSFDYQGVKITIGDDFFLQYKSMEKGYIHNAYLNGILLGINQNYILYRSKETDRILMTPLPSE